MTRTSVVRRRTFVAGAAAALALADHVLPSAADGGWADILPLLG